MAFCHRKKKFSSSVVDTSQSSSQKQWRIVMVANSAKTKILFLIEIVEGTNWADKTETSREGKLNLEFIGGDRLLILSSQS